MGYRMSKIDELINKLCPNGVNFFELGEIATFSQGIQVDVNKQFYEPFENSVPFIRIVDFVNDNEPPRYIEKPNEKYIKQEDEMVMIRYGASAVGKVFINKYGAIANNMFKINFNIDNIDIKSLKIVAITSLNRAEISSTSFVILTNNLPADVLS